MTRNEIQVIVDRYSLSVDGYPGPDGGGQIFLAHYLEVPGCLVESTVSREEAIKELDRFIIPFIEGMLRAGGRIPTPLAERSPRTRTHTQTISNIVAGDIKDLLAAGKNLTSAQSVAEERAQERQMEAVA